MTAENKRAIATTERARTRINMGRALKRGSQSRLSLWPSNWIHSGVRRHAARIVCNVFAKMATASKREIFLLKRPFKGAKYLPEIK
jgi:hypothetical protein